MTTIHIAATKNIWLAKSSETFTDNLVLPSGTNYSEHFLQYINVPHFQIKSNRTRSKIQKAQSRNTVMLLIILSHSPYTICIETFQNF